MKILIDMPEETYNKMRRGEALYSADASAAIFAIETGIPLEECKDCISRNAALMEIDKYLCGVPFEKKGIDEVIKDLPLVIPAEKVGQWIPVSEGLPKPYTWVYATCKSLVDDRENWVIDTCYIPLPKKYNSKYSDWGNVPMLNMGDAEVIAWMKWIIPKPYNASPTGEEDK